MIARLKGLHWLLFFDLFLLAWSGYLFGSGQLVPSISVLAGALVVVVWQIILFMRDSRNSTSFQYQSHVIKQHYFQAMTQSCVYIYWGLYWDRVIEWVPMLVAQLLFAYAIEGTLAWMRHKTWRLGFGPFPIVFSINLFFWFKEEYFYLQVLLIAITYFSKEFITWKRENRTTHIFNPSACSLAIVGLALMVSHKIGWSHGLDVIEAFYIGPHFFEVLFLLGLVSQFFFSTTLITGGAVLSMSVIFFALGLLGMPPQTPFDVSVFLGMNLLVTDPSTSPRTRMGKFLFGMGYGASVFLIFSALRFSAQPSYYDKILAVIVVNLLVTQFDVLGQQLYQLAGGVRRRFRVLSNRFVHMGAYAVLFVAVLPYLKVRDPNAVDPFPPQTYRSTPALQEYLAKAIALDIAHPDIRKPFTFNSEAKHFDDWRELNRDIADSHVRIGNGLLILGEKDLAIQRFERAMEQNPRYAVQLEALIGNLRSVALR